MSDIQVANGDELNTADAYAILRLRVDVFVVEQECPYSELDGRDLLVSTRHFWVAAEEAGEPVLGCLRVLEEPDGGYRIGRVCTSVKARGTGLAARLMRAALESIGDAESVLDAQTYATGFYAKFGYRPEGAEYLEDGIPHVVMRRPAG
ncbi:ElaA protein [Amycolatopsis marina]|uniref:ElaA protein n=1 Tax=Amycolatopsis marina TaxID=490629 RepID=A0A1I0WM46_9PSEU|nr:GNAT family N-acetyltransferase [Amycolatopsis marina]SFA89036.1 ElaA protein [Amycolatopsis marina]